MTRRRHLLMIPFATAALVAAPALPSFASSADAVYGDRHEFAVFRKGERIGTHLLTFERQGDQLTVRTTVNLNVKVLGLTAYRYSHAGEEVLRGDRLVSIRTKTDDNGQRFEVNGQAMSGQFAVSAIAPNDEPFARENGVSRAAAVQTSLPANVLPSSQWHFKSLFGGQLLNVQKGELARYSVTPMGKEMVQTANGTVAATRYRLDGDLFLDIWYDDRGRWVGSAFKGPDGSTIQYVLQ